MASKNQNFTGKQVNNSDTSFNAKAVKDDGVAAYAHADAINHEMERPLKVPEGQRKTHGGS